MIICLEGINGAGKTTVAALLQSAWELRTSEPSERIDPSRFSAFGRAVNDAILSSTECHSVAEALAFAAARWDGLVALEANLDPSRLYVIERWAGAVEAYGLADRCSPSVISVLEDLLWSRASFSTVLVDVTGETADGRLRRMSGLNRFETRGSPYLETVRGFYLQWAQRRDVPIVSADVHAEVEQLPPVLAQLLEHAVSARSR